MSSNLQLHLVRKQQHIIMYVWHDISRTNCSNKSVALGKWSFRILGTCKLGFNGKMIYRLCVLAVIRDLKLSRQIYLLKSSQAMSHVSVELKTNGSEISVFIIRINVVNDHMLLTYTIYIYIYTHTHTHISLFAAGRWSQILWSLSQL
jgi:hypothetical protein